MARSNVSELRFRVENDKASRNGVNPVRRLIQPRCHDQTKHDCFFTLVRLTLALLCRYVLDKVCSMDLLLQIRVHRALPVNIIRVDGIG